MRLIATKRAGWAERAWLQIDKPGAKQMLGRCVSVKPVQNAPGKTFTCAAPVYAGEGFADADGAPFKAYYCLHCGNAAKIQQLR